MPSAYFDDMVTQIHHQITSIYSSITWWQPVQQPCRRILQPVTTLSSYYFFCYHHLVNRKWGNKWNIAQHYLLPDKQEVKSLYLQKHSCNTAVSTICIYQWYLCHHLKMKQQFSGTVWYLSARPYLLAIYVTDVCNRCNLTFFNPKTIHVIHPYLPVQ